MNDSCEKRVSRGLFCANQVIPLETPKVFLQSALALAVDQKAAEVGLRTCNPNRMSRSGGARAEAVNLDT